MVSTGQKIVIERPGSYDKLLIRNFELKDPEPDEVQIKVYAAGINYADTIVRMGLYSSAKEYVGWPITPGFEFSGKITKLGSNVRDFKLGDDVFGAILFGAYASHLNAPAKQISLVPKKLSMLEAAAFPCVFITAYYAVFELAHPHAGKSALVHSAAGGVGSALLQLLKVAGCKVVGVVGSTHKVSLARDLGADDVIDKSKDDLWKRANALFPKGYSYIFDANGVSTLWQSYLHLSRPGKLVVYGFHSMLPKKGGKPQWLQIAWDYIRTPRFNPLRLTNDNKSVLAFNLSYLFGELSQLKTALDELLKWIEEDKIKMPQVKSYHFTDAAQAHAAIESGQSVGKLALRFD